MFINRWHFFKPWGDYMKLIGSLAFYIGLIIAIVAGWVDMGMTGVVVLTVLGIIVGLLNVTGKETSRFLLATLVFIVAGLAMKDIFGDVAARILAAYIAFTAAGGLVVALKEVYDIQKD